MIDIENKVITAVSNAVTTEYSNITIKSIDDLTPQDLPCLVVTMADNRVRDDRIDSSDLENAVISTFEITAYTNTPNTAKSEAKAILSLADDAMKVMGFTRVTMSALPTQHATVARLFARYEGTVDKNDKIYRR